MDINNIISKIAVQHLEPSKLGRHVGLLVKFLDKQLLSNFCSCSLPLALHFTLEMTL